MAYPKARGAHRSFILLALLFAISGQTAPVTFTDANWISMSVYPGINRSVLAAVVDGSGNLYIGGSFLVAPGTEANYIAKWNGSNWSALGSGMDGSVYALAVVGQ